MQRKAKALVTKHFAWIICCVRWAYFTHSERGCGGPPTTFSIAIQVIFCSRRVMHNLQFNTTWRQIRLPMSNPSAHQKLRSLNQSLSYIFVGLSKA